MAYTIEFESREGKETIGNLICTDGEFTFSATVNLGVEATIIDYKAQLLKARETFIVPEVDLTKVNKIINS